ncbi:MAG TPA: glycosyltransferase family 87 protein [Opitutaceae bacterium]|nr:glycosyltransferase family 87 protein [Opitutaceae bacterium]
MIPQSTPDFRIVARRAGLASAVAAIYALCCWSPGLLALLGIATAGVWFLDLEGALAASDAHAAGLNPLGHNPLDVFHRPHMYTDWWYALRWFGLTRADYLWVGALLGLAFLIVALLQVRVRRTSEMVLALAVVAAPPVIFSFVRGNADMAIFIVLAPAVACLLSPHAPLRWLAVAVIAFATGLKSYPAIAGLILLAPTRPRREIVAQVSLFAILVILLAFDQFRDLATNLHGYNLERRLPGFYTYGLTVTARLLAAPGWWTAVLVGALVAFAGAWWRWLPRWEPSVEQRADHLRLVMGAALLVGCYFAEINYAYRAVFAIWLVPLLAQAWTATDWPPAIRRLGQVTLVLLLAWLWSDGLACVVLNGFARPTSLQIDVWSKWIVLAQQPVVFLLMAALLAWLVAFARAGLEGLGRASNKTAANAPLETASN